ncbi:hypothetical protein HDU97_006648 [Phlyctochytrium planicorne]|nr:hypothetical protein HDU97_006648 [Phlyctochytrium planicorne]
MAAVSKKEPRVRNVVHDDAIWRQTVHYEQTTANNWEPYWGFMKEAFTEPKTDEPSKPINSSRHQRLPPLPSHHPITSYSSGLPSKLPSGITSANDNPILGDWLISYRIPEIIKARKPMEKYSVPCTTSSEVGWVWGNSRKSPKPFSNFNDDKISYHTLEKFPREAHGKIDILRWWGGGRESLP